MELSCRSSKKILANMNSKSLKWYALVHGFSDCIALLRISKQSLGLTRCYLIVLGGIPVSRVRTVSIMVIKRPLLISFHPLSTVLVLSPSILVVQSLSTLIGPMNTFVDLLANHIYWNRPLLQHPISVG